LDVPASVVDYTSEYRAENDPLREWLDECCQLGTGYAYAADLRTSYEQWATGIGEKPIGTRHFTDKLKARGCTPHKATGGKRAWNNITLTTEEWH
jgi:putative DNA primase/helicase